MLYFVRDCISAALHLYRTLFFFIFTQCCKPSLYIIEEYVCCVVCVQNDRYTVGGSETFDSLTDLVEHYKRIGIEEMSGNWVFFKQVNGESFLWPNGGHKMEIRHARMCCKSFLFF